MNFIFVSPNFPKSYWNFCDRLRRDGANVLAIGDASYESLEPGLKSCLTEYYRVDNMQDYSQMYRAVAYFTFHYGKIDWLESNNEFWLEQDARLRTDFNITTGVKSDVIKYFKSKAEMKSRYALAGVPTARLRRVTTIEDLREFISLVEYPIIAKPENGVGAEDTYKITNDSELERFFASKPPCDYVAEEFITGDICSYDAIIGPDCEPLFESMSVFPPSIADIVNQGLELSYYVSKEVAPQLRDYGRRTAKAFNAANRFVHMEFFRLTRAHKGLGEVGDFAGLEVNMRPAGGYTPDMINFAHSVDVYQIWADMACFGKRLFPEPEKEYFCAYSSRRDGVEYVHSNDEVMDKYADSLVMFERMPDAIAGAMGNQMYTVKLETIEEVHEFTRFVTERV